MGPELAAATGRSRRGRVATPAAAWLGPQARFPAIISILTGKIKLVCPLRVGSFSRACRGLLRVAELLFFSARFRSSYPSQDRPALKPVGTLPARKETGTAGGFFQSSDARTRKPNLRRMPQQLSLSSRFTIRRAESLFLTQHGCRRTEKADAHVFAFGFTIIVSF